MTMIGFLVKARTIKDDTMVTGFLTQIDSRFFIVPKDIDKSNSHCNVTEAPVEIDVKTVCKCSGMPDKDFQNIIFENDILVRDDEKLSNGTYKQVYMVQYDCTNGAFEYVSIHEENEGVPETFSVNNGRGSLNFIVVGNSRATSLSELFEKYRG